MNTDEIMDAVYDIQPDINNVYETLANVISQLQTTQLPGAIHIMDSKNTVWSYRPINDDEWSEYYQPSVGGTPQEAIFLIKDLWDQIRKHKDPIEVVYELGPTGPSIVLW